MGETDPFVRQYLRFRASGKCLEVKAFAYAHRCYNGRASNLGFAILKAMTIAGCSAKDIAVRLGTATKNVVVCHKLFFDVTRYLNQREWLGSIALSRTPVDRLNPIAATERLYLAAAYHRKWKGLEQVMTGQVPKTRDEQEEMAEAIRATLIMKAHQFASERIVAAPEPEDLARYVELMRLPQKEDSSLQAQKSQNFGRRLRELIMGKTRQNPDPQGH
jgi:hypothetical protein